jgi:hypothetical protein
MAWPTGRVCVLARPRSGALGVVSRRLLVHAELRPSATRLVDPTDNTVWVANYTGGTGSASPTYGVAEFNENGSLAQTFDYATQFTPPVPSNAIHEMPYAIAFCPTSGGSPANIVAVRFISDGTGEGQGEGGGYSTGGVLLGTQFVNTITNPDNMSCSSKGEIYTAADNGLLVYNVTGSEIGPPSNSFSGLTPSIRGVFVSY